MPAGHADCQPLFKQGLFPVVQLIKSSLHLFCLYAVPEDVGVVPSIIKSNIFARFLAVLMARNDGIDRTVARNQDLPTPDDVAKIQEHNEREKDSYSNQDIPAYRHSPEYRLPQTAYQDFYFAFWQASDPF